MALSPDLAPDIPGTVRDGVARLRATVADGTLHHHAPHDVPAGRRSHD